MTTTETTAWRWVESASRHPHVHLFRDGMSLCCKYNLRFVARSGPAQPGAERCGTCLIVARKERG